MWRDPLGWALLGVAALTAYVISYDVGYRLAYREPKPPRCDLRVVTDTFTGQQYLVSSCGGLLPRLDGKNRPMLEWDDTNRHEEKRYE